MSCLGRQSVLWSLPLLEIRILMEKPLLSLLVSDVSEESAFLVLTFACSCHLASKATRQCLVRQISSDDMTVSHGLSRKSTYPLQRVRYDCELPLSPKRSGRSLDRTDVSRTRGAVVHSQRMPFEPDMCKRTYFVGDVSRDLGGGFNGLAFGCHCDVPHGHPFCLGLLSALLPGLIPQLRTKGVL